MINPTTLIKQHKSILRIFTHFLFWIAVTALYYFTLNRLGGEYVKVLVVKELLVTSSLFYAANILFTKWIDRGKVLHFAVFFIFSFFWWITWTYVAFYFLEPYVPSSDTRMHAYLNFIIEGGYLGVFSFKKLPVFILDFLLLVSVPLAPKLSKLLVQHSNKMVIFQRDKATLEKENLKMELQVLKSQVSPHFLFNTLNSVYRMAETNDSRTSVTVLRLSNLLRYMLYRAGEEKIPLSNEIQFIKDYLTLAQLRFGADVKMDINFQPLDEPYKIVPLIFIPFVENAIKHGPERSRTDAWIKLSMCFFEGYLVFEISNGVNRMSESPPFGGIGIANVKRRLDLYYTGKHDLVIKEGERDYSVQLKIDL